MDIRKKNQKSWDWYFQSESKRNQFPKSEKRRGRLILEFSRASKSVEFQIHKLPAIMLLILLEGQMLLLEAKKAEDGIVVLVFAR